MIFLSKAKKITPFRHQVQDSESEEDFQPYFDEVRDKKKFFLNKICDQKVT